MDKVKASGRFKKAALLALIAIIAFACLRCGFRWNDSISDAQFYTSEELEEAFHRNEAQFTEVAKIVLESEGFAEKVEYGNEARARVMFKTDSQYFTEEEWQKITDFFQEIKPLDIGRYEAVKFGYTKGIAIHFPQNKEGKSVSLYYIDLRNLDDEIATARYQIGSYDVFKRIGEHWWLGAILDDNYLNGLNYSYSYYENGEFHNKTRGRFLRLDI